MPRGGSLQLAWLTRLIAANTPDEVARVIVAVVLERPSCKSASVLWALDEPGQHRGVPALAIDIDDWTWLYGAASSGEPEWNARGDRLALRLCEEPQAALLVITVHAGFERREFPAELKAPMVLAGQYLRRALEWSELQHSHQQLERSETLQRALFAISDFAGSDRDMPDMLRGIHAIVSTLMYAENFYIVQLNRERGTM